MSASFSISRRAFAGGALLLALSGKTARAQGFAGLGMSGHGFAPVVPGRQLVFPADHGPHPDFRIEWWYVTANLADASGSAYGAQWTLFRQAMAPGPQAEGWANQQIWMGHAAITRADTHRFGETFARGGVGQAGAKASPFDAWIDAWQMRGGDGMNGNTLSPLELNAAGKDFAYTLRLEADHALVLQGDAGYSVKSDQGQASYYYSQPYFKARGRITTALITPYPPGIPLLIPGEVFNKRIVEYLKFARAFNEECPGFETDIHGLVAEEGPGGKLRYFADCVQESGGTAK